MTSIDQNEIHGFHSTLELSEKLQDMLRANKNATAACSLKSKTFHSLWYEIWFDILQV